MNFFFLQNELVLALCWTLIHSLWQGLLLAIVTGAVMIGTRKSNARKRYGMLTVLFFLFIAVTMVTFVKELSLAKANTASVITSPVISNPAPVINDIVFSRANDAAASQTFTERFKDYFNTHASLIVMIWFVIFIARFIRLTANLAYVQRLKHYKTYAAPVAWKDRVNELVLTLGIKKQIQLLESGVVKVPVVMGVLKPVILLPLGLLAHLPSDEIEAILLHELAHIKRRDYFMNLLQSFAETIFFFNPALMWLSSMIREERENCCDDIAISITNSKTKFINALIAFQEYNFSTPSYTVGFPGKKNQLLNRVKRIISERNKTLNATEKSLLTFGMGVFILFSFAAAKKITPVVTGPLSASVKTNSQSENVLDEQQMSRIDYRKLRKPVTAKEPIVRVFEGLSYSPATPYFIDTTPRKIQGRINSGRSIFGEESSVPLKLRTYSAVSDSISNLFTGITIDRKDNDDDKTEFISATKKDGTLYNFRKVNGKITELFVDNKPVSTNDFAKYDAVINDIENAVKYRKQRSEERREMAAADREAKLLDKQTRLHESQLRLNEQRLLDQEARRISADYKRDLLLNHQKALHDSSRMNKEYNRLIDTFHKAVSEKAKLDMNRKAADKIKSNVKMKVDTAIMLKKGGYVVYADVIKAGDKVFRDSFNSAGKDGYARYGDVVKYSDLTERDEARIRKQEAMRARASEDDARVQESAEVMRNIIRDLEADGIRMDMKTGWFALDKEQFIVDGKKISADLHEKFRNKYIRSKDGWGYYYGPIKVTGRGVFLDYKNLVK
ncbi:MAG: M56 family metallopeptidase [Bacteroidota bacterium]